MPNILFSNWLYFVLSLLKKYSFIMSTQTPEEIFANFSNEKWKSLLGDDLSFNVLRNKGTERPWSGEYNKFYPSTGYFVCKGCKNPLYSSKAKYDSGCGWPAFDKCFNGSINTTTDASHGMVRVEITCARCDGHLGHVFDKDGNSSTKQRHCVNSVSVEYKDEAIPEGLEEAIFEALGTN